MAIISLEQNNKNQFRKYPLKYESNCISASGEIFSDKIITNASITSVYGKHRIYIKQFFKKNNYIQIAIASFFDDELLGIFSGEITQDYLNLSLTAYTKNIAGYITLGDINSLPKTDKIFNFNKHATEFEESVIFCYTPPGVSAISDKLDQTITADVNFGALVNILKIKQNNSIKFYAEFPETLYNEGDKSSYLFNCPTPIIKNINGIYPSSNQDGEPNNDNNIYIAGVYPIVFFGLPNNTTENIQDDSVMGVVSVDVEGQDLNSLCAKKQKFLPPTDITGFTKEQFKNQYYNKPALESLNNNNYPYEIPNRLAANFNAALRPEYFYWPQYVKESYYDFWLKP
jgi:hypothetical protein